MFHLVRKWTLAGQKAVGTGVARSIREETLASIALLVARKSALWKCQQP